MSAGTWALSPDVKPQVTAKTPHKPPLAAIRQRVQVGDVRAAWEQKPDAPRKPRRKPRHKCGGPYPAAARLRGANTPTSTNRR